VTLLEELASCLAMLRGSQLRLDRWMEDIRHDAAGELLLDEIEAQCAWFKPRFRVSEAAALANMHPQTLRQYDPLGLVVPGLVATVEPRDAGCSKRTARICQLPPS